MTNLGKHLIKLCLPKEMKFVVVANMIFPNDNIEKGYCLGYNKIIAHTKSKLEKVRVDLEALKLIIVCEGIDEKIADEIILVVASNLDKIIKIQPSTTKGGYPKDNATDV